MEPTHPNETESVCPVCLRKIKATRVLEGDEVFLVKNCDDHGAFKTILWRGEPAMPEWRRPKIPAHPRICYTDIEKGCPFDCGLCEAHEQLPCTILIEVTQRCNLHCAFCFADAGHGEGSDPSLSEVSRLLKRAMKASGPCNLQLSGGEPTLRDDLPEIVGIARRIGYSFIQLNTNGLRLAWDTDYVRRLDAAGLSSIFLQFDGVDDAVYRSLRGRALLDPKLRAVRNCGEVGLGVVLVPTLVRGVNTDAIGALVRQAVQLAPTVRGIHFQPVSYFGRFPAQDGDKGRFTLPELMRHLEDQTGGTVKVRDFSPPGCEHAHCSCHATYMLSPEGVLRPIGGDKGEACCSANGETGGAKRAIETVSRRWRLPPGAPLSEPGAVLKNATCCSKGRPEAIATEGPYDLDGFLQEVAARSFTISAMAFQDADTLDLERLRGCCIFVISPEGMLVPFCAYNLTSREGHSLYRGASGSET